MQCEAHHSLAVAEALSYRQPLNLPENAGGGSGRQG